MMAHPFNNTIANQLLAFVVLSAVAIIIIEDPGSIDRVIRDISGDPPIVEQEEDEEELMANGLKALASQR